MAVNVTSLVHPTMIAKIRLGLRYAALGQGDKMNGHGNRVYIQNAKGHNIIRINWLGNGKFIAYGRESKDVTLTVKQALRRANCKPVHTYMKPRQTIKERLGRAASMIGVAALLTGCQVSGAMTAVYSVMGSVLT